MNIQLPPDLQRFLQHMPPDDDITLIVLKGHLLIEEKLEHIIGLIVAHSDRLNDLRLTFAQKVALAQAMCWSKHESDMWDLIACVNSLRNEFAHQLESPKTQAKLNRLLEVLHASIERKEMRDWMAGLSEPQQLKYSIAFALGFLGSYEGDAIGYRKTVDSIYGMLSGGNDR